MKNLAWIFAIIALMILSLQICSPNPEPSYDPGEPDPNRTVRGIDYQTGEWRYYDEVNTQARESTQYETVPSMEIIETVDGDEIEVSEGISEEELEEMMEKYIEENYPELEKYWGDDGNIEYLTPNSQREKTKRDEKR